MAFFRNIVEKFTGAAPQVHLAAFGKHPGWNDHVDDMGLETDRLVAVKRLLYVQGIGANIDSGTWEALEADQRLEGFRHFFLWHMPPDLVVGRLWSSRDGKGRDKYPMIIAAQCQRVSFSWATGPALAYLEKTQERCIAAATAPEVVAAMDADRAALRQLATSAGTGEPPRLFPRQLAELAARPELGPSHQGFHRIFYQIFRGLSAYRPGARNAARRPEQLRVPRCGMLAEEAASLWLRFLLTVLDPTSPILVLVPLDEAFLDILVGEPGPAQLHCVRAGARAMPLTSDIPYSLDSQFTETVDKFLADCRSASDGPLPPLPQL